MVVAKIDYSFGFLKSEDVLIVEEYPDLCYVNVCTFAFVLGVVNVPGKEL